MRKAVFFDFGNTLVHFNAKEIIKSFGVYGNDAELSEKVIFDRKYFDKLDSGELNHNDLKKTVKEILPKHLHGISDTICESWLEHLPVIDGMPELLEKLKKDGFELYILSNISSNVDDIKDRIWIFKYFDGFVFSGVIKKTKPNKDFFEYALNKFSLKPKEAFFVDDAERNIIGAKAVGIDGFLFNFNPADAEKAIYEKFN